MKKMSGLILGVNLLFLLVSLHNVYCGTRGDFSGPSSASGVRPFVAGGGVPVGDYFSNYSESTPDSGYRAVYSAQSNKVKSINPASYPAENTRSYNPGNEVTSPATNKSYNPGNAATTPATNKSYNPGNDADTAKNIGYDLKVNDPDGDLFSEPSDTVAPGGMANAAVEIPGKTINTEPSTADDSLKKYLYTDGEIWFAPGYSPKE